VSPRKEQRTAGCTKQEAAVRLDQARKFHEAAELVAQAGESTDEAGGQTALVGQQDITRHE